jgi:hypothetical protein
MTGVLELILRNWNLSNTLIAFQTLLLLWFSSKLFWPDRFARSKQSNETHKQSNELQTRAINEKAKVADKACQLHLLIAILCSCCNQFHRCAPEMSKLLHATFGLDHYPNYLQRWDLAAIEMLEKKFEQQLCQV